MIWLPSRVAAAARDAGVRCRRCAYDLRGMANNERCPECGAPVWLSKFWDDLRYCAPHWLRTVERGVGLLAVGMLAHAAASLAPVCLSRLLGPAFAPEILYPVSYVACAPGGYLALRPEPCEPDDDRATRHNRWIVIGLTVAPAVQLVTAALLPAVASVAAAFVACVTLSAVASVVWFTAAASTLPTLRQHRARDLTGSVPSKGIMAGAPVHRLVAVWTAIVAWRATTVVVLQVATLSAADRRATIAIYMMSGMAAAVFCLTMAGEFGMYSRTLSRAARVAECFWPDADADHAPLPPSPAGGPP